MHKKLIAICLGLVTSLAFAAVDINKASEAELDSVKGIGPATSKLIISERKKSEFKDWDDLMRRVKGIGEARANKLSAEGLTVDGKPFHVDGHAAKAAGTSKIGPKPAAVKASGSANGK